MFPLMIHILQIFRVSPFKHFLFLSLLGLVDTDKTDLE